jgi:hypothetical protein
MANSTIELKNYLPEIEGKINSAALQWLEEASGELESEVKRNAAVGQPGAPTKNSWTHQVDRGAGEAYVGSAQINAVYEEYGTGEHAAEGNGRSTPWYVPVEDVVGYKKPSYQGKVVIVYGKGGKKFYKTDGKQPKMTLHNAYEKVMPKAKKALIAKLKKIK